VACTTEELVEQSGGGSEARSQLPRITNPSVSPADLSRLTADNADFAFALLGALPDRDENLFYSPHSISTALAMLYAGARGDTARQMSHALHYGLEEERLHPAFNSLDLTLAGRADEAPPQGGDPFRLNVVNRLWGQRGYEFLSSFLDLLAQHYGAGLALLDFVEDPERARGIINAWVSLQTEERIVELVPEGAVDATTVLVLTNAIYFRASWAEPFDPEDTRTLPFHRLDDSVVDVATMSKELDAGYAEGEDFSAVELLYAGDQLSMLLLVPDEGNFESFEASLDGPRVRSIIDSLSPHRVELTLPRFQVRSQPPLKGALQALGMRDAFRTTADLSGIDGTRELMVGDVIHEGFVSVDETGTEAAAATAVVIVRTSLDPPAIVAIDRPFLFLIRDIPTGAVLFVGRVVDPT
jgi:serpin B